MKKCSFLSLLLALVHLSGCSRDGVAPSPDTPEPAPASVEEAIVWANCLTVQAAAERFIESNCGLAIYPWSTDEDVTCGGQTLIAFLPGFNLLENPFHGYWTEPIDGEAWRPGETGYVPVRGGCASVGYEIMGVGAEAGHQIVRLTDADSPDGHVRRNCRRLALAILQWTELDALPSDIEADTNSTGQTPLAYLCGASFENPYTGAFTRVVPGVPNSPGEIGYEIISDNGMAYAFELTGAGETQGSIVFRHRQTMLPEEGLVVSWCGFLMRAVEMFAAMNGGRFPRDFDSHRCENGRTALDLAYGGWTNPFDSSVMEPLLGPPLIPGDIGYEPLNGGWGYRITGMGKKQGSLIWTHTERRSSIDTLVLSNSIAVERAVAEFRALNAGKGPMNLDQDTTLTGKTLVDLLPQGKLLVNPVTRKRTEPHARGAAYRGETGCQFRSEDYYDLTAIGEKGTYIRRTRR